MKKALIITSLCFFTGYINAQMVVNDPTLTAITTKHLAVQTQIQTEQLAKSVTTVTNTAKTLSLLEKVEKGLKTVNSVLQGASFVKDLYDSQRDILEMTNRKIRYYRRCRVFSVAELKIITNQIDNIISHTTTNIEVARMVLTSKTKMNDYERMKLIIESRKRQSELKQQLNNTFSELDKIIYETGALAAIRGLKFEAK